MEWHNKVKMVELGNRKNYSEQEKQEFHKFVLENVDSFDNQSWDMFLCTIGLIIGEMRKDIDFWKQIYEKVKNMDCSGFDFRSGMRLSMIKTIFETNELSK
jgi:hypothetical protein